MADLIELQEGQPPWRPTADSSLEAVYRKYDIPLVGVIGQHGHQFFFMCVDGEDERLSLWFYTLIEPDQRAMIEAMSPGEFDDQLATMDFPSWGRLALATERVGIVDFADVENTPNGPAEALEKLRSNLDHLSQEAQDLEFA